MQCTQITASWKVSDGHTNFYSIKLNCLRLVPSLLFRCRRRRRCRQMQVAGKIQSHNFHSPVLRCRALCDASRLFAFFNSGFSLIIFHLLSMVWALCLCDAFIFCLRVFVGKIIISIMLHKIHGMDGVHVTVVIVLCEFRALNKNNPKKKRPRRTSQQKWGTHTQPVCAVCGWIFFLSFRFSIAWFICTARQWLRVKSLCLQSRRMWMVWHSDIF